MKAFVTGGTGFVGSHLIEELRSRGDDVRALVRSAAGVPGVESLGAQAVMGDLDDEAALRDGCAGCDVVYHSAARVEIHGDEADFNRTTVDGTRRLAQAALDSGVKRFVQVSSCGIYHPQLFAKGAVLDERTPTPMPPHWFPYGRAKLRAEEVVREVCDGRMEWVIVRLGYLYGPRNRTMKTHVEPAMRDSTMTILGKGDNEMAFVYVTDVVRALALAGRVPEAAGRVLIAAGNEHVTQQQYFDAMADGFGMPRIRRHMPYAIAYFFSWLGEYLIRSGPRRNSVRRASVALTGLPQRVDCRETQRILGWTPEVRFEEGMRRAFEWYHGEFGAPGR